MWSSKSRFVEEDFENQFPELNNLADDLINDSVNEDDIERLPLYQILNESLLGNEEFLDNNAISINLPEQPIEISPRVELAAAASSFQPNEPSADHPSTSQTSDAMFQELRQTGRLNQRSLHTEREQRKNAQHQNSFAGEHDQETGPDQGRGRNPVHTVHADRADDRVRAGREEGKRETDFGAPNQRPPGSAEDRR
ncbi:hypothetical protein L1887_63335 [Cichorium endivia]|nr:hypothetical protein L1887_63335 [Cichorium endivia]